MAMHLNTTACVNRLANLDQGNRLLLGLYLYERLIVDEIAAVLSQTPSVIEKHLNAALEMAEGQTAVVSA